MDKKISDVDKKISDVDKKSSDVDKKSSDVLALDLYTSFIASASTSEGKTSTSEGTKICPSDVDKFLSDVTQLSLWNYSEEQKMTSNWGP